MRSLRLEVLSGYAVLSFLLFGLRLLLEPGRQYIGEPNDPQIPIWSFAWWPHALAHGLNPLVTHVVWAPHGVDLVWANTLPALAVALAPVTLALGAVTAYNAAAVLLPALAAWTAFLLCRRLTGRDLPSLLGGYLFGFSSYVLAHMAGQPQLTAVFCLPLVALLLLRYLDGELSRRRLALLLGLVLGLQLYLALEVAFSLTVALAGGLLLALLLLPERRTRLLAAVQPVVAAYALAALLAAPILYYALTDLRRAGFQPPGEFRADLANLVLPTHVEAVGAGWAQTLASRFAANETEQGAFLGPPLLAVVALYAWQRRRSGGARFLVACLLLALYAALGPELTVAGHDLLPLPTIFGHEQIGQHHLPVLDNTLPVRFVLYLWLAAAVAAALWAARARGPAAWSLAGLAALVLVPNPTVWRTTYELPAFFTQARYRPCLPPNANVLPEPIGSGGQAMLWQVADAFRFRLAGGRLQTSPPSAFLHPRSVAQIAVGYLPVRDQPALLRAYARRFGVTDAIVDPRERRIWAPALDRIAARRAVGGVLLYSLDGPVGPGCPRR